MGFVRDITLLIRFKPLVLRMDIPQTPACFYFLTKSTPRGTHPIRVSAHLKKRACSPPLIYIRHIFGLICRSRALQPPIFMPQDQLPAFNGRVQPLAASRFFNDAPSSRDCPFIGFNSLSGGIMARLPFVHIFFFGVVLADFFSNSAIMEDQAD